MRLPAVALASLTLLAPFAAACGGGDDFCSLAIELDESDLGTEVGDRAALEQDIVETLDRLDRLVEVAPDDVVSDLVRFRNGFESLARRDDGLDPTFGATAGRIRDYVSAECGLDDGRERS